MTAKQIYKLKKFIIKKCANCNKLSRVQYQGWDSEKADYAIEEFKLTLHNRLGVENTVLLKRLRKAEVYFCSKDCAILGSLS